MPHSGKHGLVPTFWDVLMPWNLKSTYFSLKMIHFLSLNIWYVIYVVFWIKYWNLKLPHHCILFLFTICTVSQLFWNRVCKCNSFICWFLLMTSQSQQHLRSFTSWMELKRLQSKFVRATETSHVLMPSSLMGFCPSSGHSVSGGWDKNTVTELCLSGAGPKTKHTVLVCHTRISLRSLRQALSLPGGTRVSE